MEFDFDQLEQEISQELNDMEVGDRYALKMILSNLGDGSTIARLVPYMYTSRYQAELARNLLAEHPRVGEHLERWTNAGWLSIPPGAWEPIYIGVVQLAIVPF